MQSIAAIHTSALTAILPEAWTENTPVSNSQIRNMDEAACMDCHVADGIYHQGNPRGSVANLTYVNRFTTTNIITTDCADCHGAANLDDAPFNAPGGGTHVAGTCLGGCHVHQLTV